MPLKSESLLRLHEDCESDWFSGDLMLIYPRGAVPSNSVPPDNRLDLWYIPGPVAQRQAIYALVPLRKCVRPVDFERVTRVFNIKSTQNDE